MNSACHFVKFCDAPRSADHCYTNLLPPMDSELEVHQFCCSTYPNIMSVLFSLHVRSLIRRPGKASQQSTAVITTDE